MLPEGSAVRKRTQIARANRTMFMWVAGISAVLGITLVAIIFLIQMLLFNERVLSEKDKTIAILKANNSAVVELQKRVKSLDADANLISVKARSDDQAIQVILDALPSDANSLALGASLQQRLLIAPGAALESLQVDPVVGIESLSTAGLTASAGSGMNEITFSFSVSGDEAALKQILKNLEASIRTISVDSVKIENQGAARVMSVKARAFYEPALTVELKTKVVE